MDWGDVVDVTFVISFIIVVMLLSIIGDSRCCTSLEVDVVLAEIFVGAALVVPGTPITFTL
jgi:hypothetical protein